MRYLLILLYSLFPAFCFSQSISEEDKFVSTLNRTLVAPDGLLASRAALLFSVDYTQKELEEIQKAFQQFGIDPVVYVESERVLSGTDLRNAYSTRFSRRQIKFLIIIRKEKQEYEFSFVAFNAKTLLGRGSPYAWFVHSSFLKELLLTIFHSVVNTQKRQNFLINDFPESDPGLNFPVDSRHETVILGIRTARIAVPKMRDSSANHELELYLKEKFHAKYEMVEDTLTEKVLAERGYQYVLHFIHARGSLAKEILGYDMSKSESALATVTYPNGSLQLKTIPTQTLIYKFYFKDLEDDNLYFGTKWDADVTWQDALRNHIDGYRVAGQLN